MANKKDVELVLRARNEASKSIDSVADALKSLDKISKDLNQTTGKTSGLMGELGSELTRLGKEATNLKELGTAATAIRAAGEAVTRLTAAANSSRGQAVGLVNEYRKAAESVKQLQLRAVEAASALKQQQESSKATGQALKEINLEVSRAEKAYTALYDQIRKAKAPSDALKDSLRSQRDTLISLYAQQDRAVSADKAAAGVLVQKKTALRETEAALTVAAKQEDVLRGKTLEAIKAHRTQRNELSGLAGSMDALRNRASDMARQLGATADSADEIAAAAARAERDLKKMAEAQLKVQQAAQGQRTRVLSGADGQVAQQREQAKVVSEARAAMQAAATESTRLGKSLATTLTPTKELNDQFLVARSRTQAATAEFLKQSSVLSKLGLNASSGFAAYAEAERKINAVASANARAAERAAASATLWGRLSLAVKDFNTALGNSGTAAEKAARATRLAAEAQQAHVNPTRTALSLMQRLRGQVLGITAAYIGFFQVMDQFRQVIDTMQMVQQTQAKMGVVFGDNTAAIASEMDFLRETSVRLGQDLSVLGKTYANLAISAQTAGFTLGDTRKLFLSVAESARVLGLTNDETGRLFKAFEQMLSKGTVQAEELKSQIGDSGLAGAYQIFAQALGMTTKQLGDTMKSGAVFADRDTLGKVADQLTKKFGGALPDALKTTGAELGKLSATQTILREKFANGGFGDAFTKAIRDLNTYLSSDDAAAFFRKLGEAAGTAVNVIVALAKNFEFLGRLIEFVAIAKFTRSILASTAASGGMLNMLGRLGTAMLALRAAFMSASVAGKGFFMAMALGVRGFFAALGPAGWIAIGLGIVIELMASWFSSVEDVNGAMDRHQKILSQVQNAYSDAAQGVDDWQSRLKDLSEGEIVSNTRQLTEKMQSELDKLQVPWKHSILGGAIMWGYSKEIGTLEKYADLYKKGELAAKDFLKVIDDIEKAAPPDVPVETFNTLRDGIKSIEDMRTAIKANDLALKAKNGTLDEATAKEVGLATAVDRSAEAMASAASENGKYNDLIAELRKDIPELKAEMDFQESIKSIEALVAAMEKLGVSEEQKQSFRDLAAQAKAAASATYASSSMGSYVDKVVGAESGGNPLAANGKSTAVGLGQFIESTWLSLFKKYFPAAAANMTEAQILDLRKNADASRKLVEAYAQENSKLLADAGVAVTDASRYLAHFLGPDGAMKLLKADPNASVNSLLPENVIDANKSVLDGKTVQQVLEWSRQKMGISTQELAVLQEAHKAEKERADEIAKYNETRKEGIDSQNFEISQQQLLNSGLKDAERQVAINKAVREAENEALKAGVTYTNEMRTADAARAAAAYDATNNGKAQKEEQARLEEAVNILLERRQMLMDQIQTARAQGDGALADTLQGQLDQTNLALDEATQKALEFMSALSGPEAENARLKLQGISQDLKATGNSAVVSGKQINDMLAGGASQALDRFSQAVAESANGFTSLRDAFLQFAADFLREIAQIILKVTIMNALGADSSGGGGLGGTIANFISGLFHEGGVVGQGGGARLANPAWFQNAARYHTGGIAGLKPNEVPAILQKGEEVLTANDPRHIANGSSSPVNVKVVNTIDPGSFVSEGLSTSAGEQSVLNFIRSNSYAVRSALGV